ncbi:uncharacterized protein LOC128417527 [Podarcis raffonei]|uniref:uncharacterized protein LOC128417527 n=1 Tax=Podarcis raffonei TaxID=65483 RepID=UPI00232978A6|nr:uncharacterized protein LOC128417527 [Podarcis raffonei]
MNPHNLESFPQGQNSDPIEGGVLLPVVAPDLGKSCRSGIDVRKKLSAKQAELLAAPLFGAGGREERAGGRPRGSHLAQIDGPAANALFSPPPPPRRPVQPFGRGRRRKRKGLSFCLLRVCPRYHSIITGEPWLLVNISQEKSALSKQLETAHHTVKLRPVSYEASSPQLSFSGFEPCCLEGAISSSLRAMTLYHFRHILLPPFTWVAAIAAVAVAAAVGLAPACLPSCVSTWLALRENLSSAHSRQDARKIWAEHSVPAGREEMCDSGFLFPPTPP